MVQIRLEQTDRQTYSQTGWFLHTPHPKICGGKIIYFEKRFLLVWKKPIIISARSIAYNGGYAELMLSVVRKVSYQNGQLIYVINRENMHQIGKRPDITPANPNNIICMSLDRLALGPDLEIRTLLSLLFCECRRKHLRMRQMSFFWINMLVVTLILIV